MLNMRSRPLILPLVVSFVMVLYLLSHFKNNYELVIQEKEMLIQTLTDQLSCATIGTLPNGGFCVNDNNKFEGGGTEDFWDGFLCSGLEDLFGYSSVGDMGCGRGNYGGCFLRLNNTVIPYRGEKAANTFKANFLSKLKQAKVINKPKVIRSWEGFEAADNLDEKSGGLIHTADLAKPLNLDYRFDWVMSLEVGEHIPKESESIFIDNLVNYACKGAVVSWAVPGQLGHHHINNQPNEYIKEQMMKKGLVHDDEAQARIRNMVHLKYFRNTLMVFRFPQERC